MGHHAMMPDKIQIGALLPEASLPELLSHC